VTTKYIINKLYNVNKNSPKPSIFEQKRRAGFL